MGHTRAVPDDPVTDPAPGRVEVVAAGHRRDAATARRGLESHDARIREAALGALARAGGLETRDLVTALSDASPAVRRRACDLAALVPAGAPREGLMPALEHALADDDALVVEAACWALGEWGETRAVQELAHVSGHHPDARAREAAVAALGAVGDRRGLAAILHALGDRPTVRRRAVVALAAFDGEDVADALRRSASDRDWQVREVAEIVLDE